MPAGNRFDPIKVFLGCHASERRFWLRSFSGKVSSHVSARRSKRHGLTRAVGPAPGTPLYQARTQIYRLQDTSNEHSKIKTVHLTHDVGGLLKVYASDFTLLPGDKTEYEWKTPSGPQTMSMPLYSLTKLEKIELNVLDYINEYAEGYLAELKSCNEIMSPTIEQAIRYAKLRRVSGLWHGVD